MYGNLKEVYRNVENSLTGKLGISPVLNNNDITYTTVDWLAIDRLLHGNRLLMDQSEQSKGKGSLTYSIYIRHNKTKHLKRNKD